MAQSEIWLGNSSSALKWAERSLLLSESTDYKRDLVRAIRLKGEASLCLGDISVADDFLHKALTQSREINFVEEELSTLIALSKLYRRRGELATTRNLINDILIFAERGHYVFFQTDAFNILAQVERDVDNRGSALVAANKAYQLVWCDGPPFAYYWGLTKAKEHLIAIGSLEPVLPPFDISRFKHMEEVHIELENL